MKMIKSQKMMLMKKILRYIYYLQTCPWADEVRIVEF